MQDDFRPAGSQGISRKPKVIQPLPNTAPQLDASVFDRTEPEQVSSAVVTDPPAVEEVSQVEDPTPPVTSVEPTLADDTDELAELSTGAGFGKAAKPPKDPASPSRFKFRLSWPPSKREWFCIVSAVLIVLAGGGAAYSLTHRDVKPVATHVVKKKVVAKPAAPTVVASTLSGLPVAPEVNQRPVTGVMIENSPDARPQSGLDQASIVFEAIAEGGVTRFMALFQDTQPDYLGPVRSARPYYVQWCMSFDCAYAHVGGSPDGLSGIKTWGTKDLDQFANSGSYHRISTRYAPHNVYTSVAELNQLEASKGFAAAKFTGFSRKAEQVYKAPDPAATGKAAKDQDTRTPATSINFTLSGYYYDPHFDYGVATNSYKRSEAGQPHMEQHQDGSQVQISPKVVVGMMVPLQAGALDAQGAAYSNYQVVGSGKAVVFQDGTVTTVNWSKPDIAAALSFTDDAGKPFKLNPGQTWITAITDASKASYK